MFSHFRAKSVISMPVCISVEGKYVNLVKSCKFKVGFSQVSAVCEVAVR